MAVTDVVFPEGMLIEIKVTCVDGKVHFFKEQSVEDVVKLCDDISHGRGCVVGEKSGVTAYAPGHVARMSTIKAYAGDEK